MSIHYLDDAWPEKVEEPSRWTYNIGDKVIMVKAIVESFSVNVRTA